jgi:hypothetical protein
MEENIEVEAIFLMYFDILMTHLDWGSYGYSEEDKQLIANIDARLAALRPGFAESISSGVESTSIGLGLEPSAYPAAEELVRPGPAGDGAAAGQPQNYLLSQVNSCTLRNVYHA